MEKSIQNRNEVFNSIQEKLPKKRELILRLIKESEPCTSFELSEKYNIPINEITGRVKGLKNRCLVVECGLKVGKSSSRLHTVYETVKTQIEIDALRKGRYVKLRYSKDQLVSDFQKGLSKYTKDFVSKEIGKIDALIKVLG